MRFILNQEHGVPWFEGKHCLAIQNNKEREIRRGIQSSWPDLIAEPI